MSASETFVPFLPGRTAPAAVEPARPAAPAPHAARTAEKGTFVPSLPAKPCPAPAVPSGDVRNGIPAPAVVSAATSVERPHAAHGQPSVTLLRDGDAVTRIRVECACGSVIELDCVY